MAAEAAFKKRGADYALMGSSETLPAEYYHSEEIFKAEIDKVFCGRWILAAREEEVAAPGDYRLIAVGDESIILTRGKDKTLRAFFNVCRHRGTRMCVTSSGSFKGGKIGCPYHAWSYSLEGDLHAAPLMDETKGFDKAGYPLFKAAVHVWGGFVFINLSESPKPFAEEMGALEGRFPEWNLGELRIAHKIEYEIECNWKLVIHNYQECYHCPGVHPRLAKLTPFRGAKHDCFEGSVIGGYMEMAKKGGGMTMDGEPAGPPLGSVSGDLLNRIYYYSIFPNMLLTPHPDFVMFHRVRPVSVSRTALDCYWLSSPETIADPARMKRLRSAVEFWDLTNREDWTVCEQMQQGTRSRRFSRGVYSAQEDILAALDKEFQKAVGRS